MRRILVAALLVALAAACGGAQDTGQVPVAEAHFFNAVGDVTYTGSDACFACHESEYTSFQDHGMANSVYRLTSANAVEEYPGPVVRDPNSGYAYRPRRENDRFFQEETLRGPDGQVIHRLEREMKFVMGSGTAARTYMDEDQGFLYVLPLTWYTQEGRWDFSPGYRVGNKRFDRKVPDRCMACHNAYPEAVPFTDGKYDSVPEGIGCERCHGPGALHVAERLAVPEPQSEIDSTIVNPAHLSLDRKLDVCQQCHLSGTVSILRAGAGPFDFRPSHDLAGYLSLFSEPDSDEGEGIGVISHADRMQQSACFIQTIAVGANFECTTCHDPHEGFRDSGPSYFNQTCLDCHGEGAIEAIPAHTAETNCIDCHMPKVEAAEAPHSSFTDHMVRVVGSRESGGSDAAPAAGSVTSGGTGADSPPGPASGSARHLSPYFDVDGTPEGDTYRGMAHVILGRQRGDRDLLIRGASILDSIATVRPIHGEAHLLRGLAWMELGDITKALPGLEAAVSQGLADPERLNALAQGLEAGGGAPDRIEQLYRDALAAQPARADIAVNAGRFLESAGRLAEAVELYRAATREQPRLASAWYNLGTALVRAGDLPEGLHALRRSARLDPMESRTWGNLGAVYGQMALPDSARGAFRRAVELAPGDAVALANLGAFHLNQEEFQEAIRHLGRAIDRQPGFADALANRALAHLQLGERASAALYARRALDSQPGHGLATQVLNLAGR